MSGEAEPLLAPEAREDLEKFSVAMKVMLQLWMQRILNGQVDPDTIDVVKGPTSERDWKSSEFGRVAVLFRFLNREEKKKRKLRGDQMLVGRIVPIAYLEEVAEELMAQAEKEDAALDETGNGPSAS